ncbi:phage tail protein [Pseudomonas sp. GL-B-19]|uniref:phage tail-collar fiber domain-containing protein n=1 Tax=Pseudomonas sp. GL-B-19 TaxID=2832393 RepID=UPI0029585E90|nr:phage tail protein [Pseudomonas sp. GL-B-19]
MIDKTSQFFAILTAVGEAKHANAIAMGLDWMFTEMGLGDANGTDPIPDRLQTQLINEWRRAPLNQIRVDPANPNTVITEQIIPPEVGGEWIREMGLYDVDGDLVAVANCAPSYKPLLAQGTGKTQVVRMNFIVSSSANIVLKIDPAVVLATREYVDTAISEALAKLDHKQSARVAATVPITLSNVQTLDGVAVAAGDRVLVTAQAQAQDNGIYLVSAEGWTRAADADNSLEVTPGLFIHVEQGTTNGDSLWQLVTDAPITLGTTGLQFEMIAGGNGAGVGTFRSVTVDALGRVIAGTNPTTLDGYGITDALAVSENLADLADVVEARDNLGLGTAATADVQTDLDDVTVNALMKVGAFGLGVLGPTVVDLNALQGTQFFGFRDGAVGGVPGTGYDAVGWQVEASGQRTQFAVLNSALFIRSDDGNNIWGEWVQQWDSNTLVKQANSTDSTAGRVLLNGAFGLGGKAPELPGHDFNAAQVGGTYTYAADYLNRPNVPNGSTHGLVVHMERSFGNLAYQEARAADSATYYRFRTGDFATGTWGEWEHLWDSSNLVKQTSPQDDTPGHVLVAGAYGWGQGGILIADGTDIDTLTDAGVYRVTTGPNIPAGAPNSTLLVMKGVDVTTQLMIANSSGTLYTRGLIIGSAGWGAWAMSWDTSNFDPASYQPSLGFTPVQQGGGVGQSINKVFIGYRDDTGDVGIQVDTTDFGKIWTESNFNPALYQLLLNFTPVQQGGGAGQDANKVHIGYSNALGIVKVQVDTADMGAMWTDAIGTEKVRSAIASFVVGAVGTYGMFRAAAGGAIAPGSLTAGGNLFYSDAYGLSSQGPPVGTWMLMGALNNTDNSTDDSVSIYLRVA